MNIEVKTAVEKLRGATIIRQMKAAGIKHVLSVPDLHTSRGLLMPIPTIATSRTFASARRTSASASRPASPTATFAPPSSSSTRAFSTR